jgi:type I restriction enzyme S subunit
MTPEQLKASILQYAIQGKLVEQRPEEGTGEELYRQIQAEKQRLIKEGKIKKEKALPEISEDEFPFEIPESWRWVRWGYLSQSIQYGYNAPAQDVGRIKMVRISDIQDGKVLWDTVPYCEIREEAMPTYLLQKNDILFARTGGTVGKSYLVKDVPEESIYAGYLIRTRYSSLLCPEYMKYFMESLLYWDQLRNGTIATAQPNCNGKTLSKMILPLPPLAEQKRIVAKIEELLLYVDRYAAAYEKLEQFNAKFPEDMKKSILQYAIQGKLVEQRLEEGTGAELYKQMQAEKQRLIKEKKIKKEKTLVEITDDEIPFDIPETWIWIRVGDVGSWGSGATPPRTNPAYYGGSIPWLKTGDLNDGFIKEVPEFITELALEKTSLRLNPVGSVLMAMYGATIGKLGILEIPVTTNQACCACIPYAGMYNKYLFYYLMSMRQTYIGMAEGGAQPNISKEKIVNSILPLPPLEEQHRIVAKLEEILPLCERLK